MTIARCAQAAVLVGIIGCGGDTKPDTTKGDTTTGVVENLEPPPPPPAEISNMGQMQLLRGAPNDGRCDSSRTSTEKRIILEGDAPVRIITVGVSHTTGRPFVPAYGQARHDLSSFRFSHLRLHHDFGPLAVFKLGDHSHDLRDKRIV